MRVTLVGEGGAEAGLCLWECVCEDDDDASFADAAFADPDEDLHLERGSARARRARKSPTESGSGAARTARGARAPRFGDGRARRELQLRGGSRVSVFPPGTRWRSRPRSRRGSSGGGWSSGRSSPSDARLDGRRPLERIAADLFSEYDGECLRSGTTVFDVCKDDIRCPRPRCSPFGLIDIVSIFVVSAGTRGCWRRHAWRDPPGVGVREGASPGDAPVVTFEAKRARSTRSRTRSPRRP